MNFANVVSFDFAASTAENPHFREFIDDLLSKVNAEAKHTSRRTASRHADQTAAAEKAETLRMIRQCVDGGGKLAVTVDYGSTLGNTASILGMTAVVIAPDWSSMSEAVLSASPAPGRHTTEVVNRQVEEVLSRSGFDLSWIQGITHDGGSNVQHLLEDISTCVDVPCEAHRLSLIAKNVMMTKVGPRRTFKDVYDNFHAIVTTIRSSVPRREYFMGLQEVCFCCSRCVVRVLMPSCCVTLLQSPIKKMLRRSPDHKFIFLDAELSSVVELFEVLVKCDPSALFPSSGSARERGFFSTAIHQLQDDIGDLRLIAPIFTLIADDVEFLSCASRPRIGHVRRVVFELQNMCAELERKCLDDLERHQDHRIALPVAIDIINELETVYSSDVIDHDLYLVTEMLTPSAAIGLNDAAAKRSWAKVVSLLESDMQAAASAAVAVASSSDGRALADTVSAKKRRLSFHKSRAEATFEAVLAKAASVYIERINTLNSEAEARVASGRKPEEIDDLQEWKTLRLQCPELAALARRLLVIQPTQTGAERVFSRVKHLTRNRQSLTGKRLDAFTVSFSNALVLKRMYPSFRRVLDGDDDTDEDESAAVAPTHDDDEEALADDDEEALVGSKDEEVE